MTDLLSGQVQMMFATMASSIEYINAGKLRALAVTTTTRSDARPDIPIMADFVSGFEASDWFGVCAPKGTPSEVVDKLNNQINTAFGDPVMKGAVCRSGRVRP